MLWVCKNDDDLVFFSMFYQCRKKVQLRRSHFHSQFRSCFTLTGEAINVGCGWFALETMHIVTLKCIHRCALESKRQNRNILVEHSDSIPFMMKYHKLAHFQLLKMPFWPLKRVSKLAKMVKDSNFLHSYPKIGVFKLQNAVLPRLPWWKKAKIHRFFKKQSEWNTL